MSDHWLSKGLKCDAPGCSHREDVLEITEALIGKPCPKCGASLLTKEDFVAGKTWEATIDMLAAMSPKSRRKRKAKTTSLVISANPRADSLSMSIQTRKVQR